MAEPRNPWGPTQNGDAQPRCPLPVRSPEGASGSQHGPFWPGHRWGANFKPLTVRDWATHKFASAIEQHGLLDFHRFPWSIAFESKRARDAPEHFVWWQYVDWLWLTVDDFCTCSDEVIAIDALWKQSHWAAFSRSLRWPACRASGAKPMLHWAKDWQSWKVPWRDVAPGGIWEFCAAILLQLSSISLSTVLDVVSCRRLKEFQLSTVYRFF